MCGSVGVYYCGKKVPFALLEPPVLSPLLSPTLVLSLFLSSRSKMLITERLALTHTHSVNKPAMTLDHAHGNYSTPQTTDT